MIKVFGSNTGKEELQQIEESIQNEWLGPGPKMSEFETIFKQKINCANFLMIDNASNGLYMALKLLDLPPGSEVIVPSFTWIACAHAISMCDCKPVFCDVDLNTQNITAKLIEPLLTINTKAIIVVHYAGLPANMTEILGFNIPVIEDAAHAVDSKYNGTHCGTIGDIGVYSFDSMKNVAVGEGGGLTCRTNQIIERAERMRLCGIGASSFKHSSIVNNRWWEQEPSEVFIKMTPSDISACLAIAQITKLEAHQQYRKSIWDQYQQELENIGDLVLPVDVDSDSSSKHSYFTFLLRTKKRDELAFYLRNKSIYTTLRFFPIHLMKIYKTSQKLKNVEELSETALNIPLHPALSQNDVGRIIQEIKTFFS